MSFSQTEEKNHEPSSKKRLDLKKRGVLPRSPDLTVVLLFFAAALFLSVCGKTIVTTLADIMKKSFTFNLATLNGKDQLIRQSSIFIDEALYGIFPFSMLMIAVAVFGALLVGGWGVRSTVCKPQLERVNPISGLIRLVSIETLVEGLKSIMKIVFVSFTTLVALSYCVPEYLGFYQLPFMSSLDLGAFKFLQTFVALSVTISFVLLVDLPFQYWRHNKVLKMSRQELKEEQRDMEGIPEIKLKLKEIRTKQKNHSLIIGVKKAKLVLHVQGYAIALSFDVLTSSDLVVCAKAKGVLTNRLVDLAKKNNIPIVENNTLAKELFEQVKVNGRVPPKHYKVIAKLFSAFVPNVTKGV